VLRGIAPQTELGDPAWEGDAFLVGRSRELTRLTAFLDRVRAGG